MTSDDNGDLYVLGGKDSSDVQHSDVWKLNMETLTWELVRADCSGPRCSNGRGALLHLSEDAEPIIIGGYTSDYNGVDAHQLRDGRWITEKELTRNQTAPEDCDGDDVPEEDYGRICRNDNSWWAPVGKLVCGVNVHDHDPT